MEPGACEARVRRAPCRRPAVARPRREKDNRAKHPEHKTKNTRPDTWRRTSHPAAKQLTTTSSTTSNTTTYVSMPLSFRFGRGSERRTCACSTSAEHLQSPFEVAGDRSAQFSRGGSTCARLATHSRIEQNLGRSHCTPDLADVDRSEVVATFFETQFATPRFQRPPPKKHSKSQSQK